MIPAIAALISAVCFYFGLGLHDAWPLAWIAPLPILWLAYGEAKAWKVGLAAFAAYALGCGWLYEAYGRIMGPRILILALIQGLLFAAMVLLARLPARRLPPAIGWLAFPALWTTAELGISFLPDGTFGSWAYSQVGQPLLIQSASVFGLWSISFVIAAVASGLAMSAQRKSWRLAGAVVLLFALNLGFGAWRLAQPAAAPIKVAVAARDDDAYEHGRALTEVAINAETVLAEATEARALAAKGARYIVFPEKTALVRPQWRQALFAPLIQAADETGSTIVAGFDQDGPDRRNLAVVFAPHQPAFSYAKRHMVPVLEGKFLPGPGPGLFAPGRAVAICKDMDFQATLRGDAQSGAATGGVGMMLVPAWDFDSDAWAHARMAILRGVEGGYAVVRSAKNGLVTVSDAQGRILGRATSGKGAFASVLVDVAPGAGGTAYLKLGDLFAWCCAGLAGLFVLASFMSSRKR
jgi:apolipoprotein N-acyltransferase